MFDNLACGKTRRLYNPNSGLRTHLSQLLRYHQEGCLDKEFMLGVDCTTILCILSEYKIRCSRFSGCAIKRVEACRAGHRHGVDFALLRGECILTLHRGRLSNLRSPDAQTFIDMIDEVRCASANRH